MALNENFRFVSTANETIQAESKEGIHIELETFFDSVMSTVVDYFEEATVR